MSMSETVAVLEVLENLRDACYKNSVDHGFWDEQVDETVCGVCRHGKDRHDPEKIRREHGPYGGSCGHHACNCSGFVPWIRKPWDFGQKIALIHSELSEMFEAWRKSLKESDKDIQVFDSKHRSAADPIGMRRITAIEEEAADVLIRLLDLCGKLDIDVGRVTLAKMAYNAGRPMMHGGRRC